jgi:hypothetical protein
MQTRGRGQFTTTVAGNEPLCRDHHRLILTLPSFPATQPGQFIQILCDDLDASADADVIVDWNDGSLPALSGVDLDGPRAMLRRPFSLAGRRDGPGGVELDIIHRVVGVGTAWLAKLRRGDRVGVLGPLGNVFTLPPPGATAILVGGGVGIPPMLYLATVLGNRPAVAFCGSTSRDLLPLTLIGDPGKDPTVPRPIVREFAIHGIPSVVSTDDGSFGAPGYVTHALEHFLDSHSALSTVRLRSPQAQHSVRVFVKRRPPGFPSSKTTAPGFA